VAAKDVLALNECVQLSAQGILAALEVSTPVSTPVRTPVAVRPLPGPRVVCTYEVSTPVAVCPLLCPRVVCTYAVLPPVGRLCVV
jgi:hypothetical protein